MPSIARQTATQAAVPLPTNGDSSSVLGSIVPAASLKTAHKKVCLYGRNRLGKSTLAAQFPKPLLCIATEPAENGGADSIMQVPGVSLQVVSLKPQVDPRTGRLEKVFGTAKFLQTIAELQTITQQAGKCPFATVVVDSVTALQDIVLAELMQVSEIPTMLKWGMVGEDQYRERSEKTREMLRKVLDLRCHVVLTAKERDHNPPKERSAGSSLTRSAQEGSFFAPDLGGSTAAFLQDACGNIFQLYQDSEIRRDVQVVQAGDQQQEVVTLVPTGKMVRRLRCMYHANYSAGVRSPVSRNVPEYVEAVTPEDMYEGAAAVMCGVRTKFGRYLTEEEKDRYDQEVYARFLASYREMIKGIHG